MSQRQAFATALVSSGAPGPGFNYFRSPVYVTALVVDKETGKIYYRASATSAWLEAAGGGGGGAAAWGDITGTLADQTDLQAALNAKAASSHTHPATAISDSTSAGRALLTAADAPAQRTALGLGTAATQSSAAFEPAGAVSAALAGLAAVATSGAYSDLSGRPTLGTAAAAATTDFAAAVHGHSDATSGTAGFMAASDKSKLDGIEAGATADMTGSEIVSAINTQLGSTTWQGGGGGGSDPWTWLVLGSNSTVNVTTYTDVPGMSFTAQADTTYLVDLIGAYQTGANTTGIGVTLTIPSGSIIGQMVVNTSAVALGGTEIIASGGSTGASAGVRASNTNTPIQARFVVAVGGTSGTVQLRQRSEVGANNTVLIAALTILGYRSI